MNKEKYFENIKQYKFIANKSLGQNFLIDYNVASKIVDTLNIDDNDNVLEIGCGLGSLSYFLNQKSANTTLIDVDEKMVNLLHENLELSDNMTLLRQNILKFDVSSFSKIIGNLPYYITSSIIEYLLLNAKSVTTITLMVQKEVYFKLNDKKEISPLSLLLHYVCDISSPTIVSRNAFSPIPHVDSAYFTLKAKPTILEEENKALYKLMCRMFLYRRKNILNCLSSLAGKDKANEFLKLSSIDSNLRPEQLNIEDYKKLLNVLQYNDEIIKILKV